MSNPNPNPNHNPNNFSNPSTIPSSSNQKFMFKPVIEPSFFTRNKIPILLTAAALGAYGLYRERYSQKSIDRTLNRGVNNVYDQVSTSANRIGDDLDRTGRTVKREVNKVGHEISNATDQAVNAAKREFR